MYTIKRGVIVIVINIFLLLATDVVGEYLALVDRFDSVSKVVDTALDQAIDSTVTSEELFSEKYATQVLSQGLGKDSTSNASVNGVNKDYYINSSGLNNGARAVGSQMLYYAKNDNKFIKVNPFVLSMYYDEFGYYPPTQQAYTDYAAGHDSTADIFAYLYGDVGESYSSGEYDWGITNKRFVDIYNNISRTDLNYALGGGAEVKHTKNLQINNGTYNARINTERAKKHNNFQAWVDTVGKQVKYYSYMKKKVGDGFSTEPHLYPLVSNIGFNLTREYDDSGDSYDIDAQISTVKVGKAIRGIQSYYYLTPYSLGLTYVPHSVLQSTLHTNIDTQARLNLLGYSTTDGNNQPRNIAQSNGCVGMTEQGQTGIYNNYNGQANETAVNTEKTHLNTKHLDSSGHTAIVNDGQVEYCMDTLETKIEYFVVDMYDGGNPGVRTTAKERIAEVVYGNRHLYDSADKNLTITGRNNDKGLWGSDSSHNTINNYSQNSTLGYRIIAKVTTRIKVYIPYQSAMMRLMCSRRVKWANNHYGMKSFDPTHDYVRNVKTDASDDPDEDIEGVWYQTTSYYCTAR